MDKCGILKTKNGHIEYYVDTDEKYGKDTPMLIATHTKDGKTLLQLDRFDIFNLFQICQEYVQEIQMKSTPFSQKENQN